MKVWRSGSGTKGRNFSGKYSLWRSLSLFQTPTTMVSGMRPAFTSRSTARCTSQAWWFQLLLASKSIWPSCM